MSWSSVVVGDVNTERFIDEVKVRPSLWNSASDDYKDRDLKKRQWIELCILFDDQFEALTPKEKAEKCKGLQAKWKNIKDRYRKYLKSLKTKSGQARKNVTTYVFAANLSFLDGVVEMGPTQASPNVQQTQAAEDGSNEVEEDVEEIFIEDGLTIPDDEQASSSRDTTYRRRKQRIEDKLEKYIDSFQPANKVPQSVDCDDMNFFKSLLPIVKPLPIHEKIKLRVDFMNIAYKYSQQQSSTCTATSRQATTPRSNYNSPLDVDISGQSSKRSYFEPTLPPAPGTSRACEAAPEKHYHELQPMRHERMLEKRRKASSSPQFSDGESNVTEWKRRHLDFCETSDFNSPGGQSTATNNTEMSYSEVDFF